jgi:flavin-dependent thymidylate synthase
MTQWADDQQYVSAPLPSELQVYLVSATPDPLGAVAAMAGMYEGRIFRSLAEISDADRLRYFEEVHKTHLKAPFEAIQFLFLLEGVDRAFTHQLVRSRLFTYAQESLRFAVVDDLPSRVQHPPSIQPGTREEMVWDRAMENVTTAYEILVGSGVPAEDARGLLPHATQTRIMVRCDYRNLLKMAGDRLCTQAQFVWRIVFTKIIDAIRKYEFAPLEVKDERDSWPVGELLVDGPFAPVCYDLGHCPFDASFDRRCTIRSRVQEGKFEEIAQSEWMLDPAAARRK